MIGGNNCNRIARDVIVNRETNYMMRSDYKNYIIVDFHRIVV